MMNLFWKSIVPTLKRVQRLKFVTLRDPIQFEPRMEIWNWVAAVWNTIVPDEGQYLGKI